MNINQAARFSMHNKKALEQSQACGCYHCLRIFTPKDIVEWTDEGDTAICPNCSVDAVLPECPDFRITPEILDKLRIYWF